MRNPFKNKKKKTPEKPYGAKYTPEQETFTLKQDHNPFPGLANERHGAASAFGMKSPAHIKAEQITVPTSGKKSTAVMRTSYLSGGVFASDGQWREYPIIPFNKRFDYYFTVGKVQNVVDAMQTDITNRKWYFKDTTDGGKGGAYTKELKAMEHWAKYEVQVSQLFEEIIQNWTIGGTYIVSPKDWMPIQLISIRAKIRDVDGNTLQYVQVVDGQEVILEAKEFLEVPYKAIDRLAWGAGLFDSLMNDRWTDMDGRQVVSQLDWYKQKLQDFGRIIHNHSNPLDIYTPAEGEQVSSETIDNDLIPLIGGAKPGDKLIINKRLEVIENKTDGKSRFTEYSDANDAEIDSGLQSSKTRLITEPSAMADAGEAGDQDDDRILGVMEKLTIFMNKHVIPKVLGLDAGWVEFEWGEKDSFHRIMPPHLKEALETGLMQPEEVRQVLENQHGWSFPELNEKNQALADKRDEDKEEQQQLQQQASQSPQKIKDDNDVAVQQKKDNKAEIEKRVLLLTSVEKQLEELK